MMILLLPYEFRAFKSISRSWSQLAGQASREPLQIGAVWSCIARSGRRNITGPKSSSAVPCGSALGRANRFVYQSMM